MATRILNSSLLSMLPHSLCGLLSSCQVSRFQLNQSRNNKQKNVFGCTFANKSVSMATEMLNSRYLNTSPDTLSSPTSLCQVLRFQLNQIRFYGPNRINLHFCKQICFHDNQLFNILSICHAIRCVLLRCDLMQNFKKIGQAVLEICLERGLCPRQRR